MGTRRYSARELAEKAGVSVRTVRFYEKEKLLMPTVQDKKRLYGEEALLSMQKIIALKYVGYSLREIRSMLGGEDKGSISISLDTQKRMLLAKREKLDRIIQVIEDAQDTGGANVDVDRIVNIMQAFRVKEWMGRSFYLHETYSTNAYGWYPWLFDRLCLQKGMGVLDVGCGAGLIWQRNLGKVPEGCQMVCLDKNPEILQVLPDFVEQRKKELRPGVEFRMVLAKAEEATFLGQKYDRILANYILDFVQDKDGLLKKLRAAMKPDARLMVAASGERKFFQLYALADTFFGNKMLQAMPKQDGMENGELEALLDGHFSSCTMERYEDALRIDSAEDICAYLLDRLPFMDRPDPEERKAFHDFVVKKLEKDGPLTVEKDSRVYICSR